jgi:hypothetical protein
MFIPVASQRNKGPGHIDSANRAPALIGRGHNSIRAVVLVFIPRCGPRLWGIDSQLKIVEHALKFNGLPPKIAAPAPGFFPPA